MIDGATGQPRKGLSAPWLMVAASFLFAAMGVCVKLASEQYGSGEIVFYRSLVGALMLAATTKLQGGSLRTAIPGQHFWRAATGVTALCLWFYAIGKLPLATAVTLNYSSSVWMALFLVASSMILGGNRVDGRLLVTVVAGFAGVALILRPTMEQNQLWHGLVGLVSGMISALAYLQVTALGRAGEPEYRVVFYFSLGGIVAGALLTTAVGWHGHTPFGIAMLVAVGVLATVAQLLMTRAYGTGRPLVNASLQYLGIAFAFVWGVLLFDDRVTWPAVAGMLLIVAAGVRASQLRPPDAATVTGK